jgi:hypothetical protein
MLNSEMNHAQNSKNIILSSGKTLAMNANELGGWGLPAAPVTIRS